MTVASFFMRTLYSSSSPRVGSPPARNGISMTSLRNPSGYSRARGATAFAVSSTTSRGAHRRSSPDNLPSLSGSQLNSAGNTALNMISVAATSAPAVMASMRGAAIGFEICPSIVTSNSPHAEIAGELIFDEHESGGQDQRVHRDRGAFEARAAPP